MDIRKSVPLMILMFFMAVTVVVADSTSQEGDQNPLLALESVYAGAITGDNDNNDNDLVELDLETARERMLEYSRDAQRAELGLDEVEIKVNRVRSERSDMEEKLEEFEGKDEKIIETRGKLSDTIDKVEKVDEETVGFIAEAIVDEEDKEKEEAVEQMLNVTREATIFMLQSERSSLNRQLSEMDEQIDEMEDAEEEIDQGVEEAEQGEELAEMEWEASQELIKFGGEASYVGLLTMEEQIAALEEGLEVLDRLLKEQEQQVELGKSLPVKSDLVELEKTELENTLTTLEETQREMEIEFLDNLGYSMDKDLELADISYDIENFSDDLDLEEIREKVFENSEELEIARTQMENAEDNMDWASDQYAIGTNDYREREIALKESELDLEESKKELERSIQESDNSFNKNYRDLQTAEKDVEIQEELLEAEELSEEKGLATGKQVLDTLVEVEEAIRSLKQAEYETYLAKRELQLLKDGYLVDIPDGQEMEGEADPGMDPGQDKEPGMDEPGMDDPDMDDPGKKDK